MHHDVGAIARRRRLGEADTERGARDGRTPRIEVDQLDVAPCYPTRDPGDETTDGAGRR